MRFWLTVVVGIALVTAVSTAIYVYNPELQIRKEQTTVVADAASGEAAPKAVPDALEKTEQNLPQMHEGQTVFEIRNDGKTDLSLRPEIPNCTCVSSEIRRTKSDGTIEFVKLVGPKSKSEYFNWEASEKGRQFVYLEPGQTGKFIVAWKTEMKMGKDVVRAPLRTNDPVKRLDFRVVLDIKPDVLAEPRIVEFGHLDEGGKAELSTLVYSTIRSDLTLSDIATSAKSLHAKIEPIPPDDAKRLTAKSGGKLVIWTDGTQPVGPFYERVTLKTNIRNNAPLEIGVTGDVTGKIEVAPSNRVDFKIVALDENERQERRDIFARGLPPGTHLRVDEVEPKFLAVQLNKDPKIKTLWTLTIAVPRDARPGEFKGNIGICDQAGNRKLNISVQGIVAGGAYGDSAAN
jgi:hypothetical protein